MTGESQNTVADDADFSAATAAVRHAIDQFAGCSDEERAALRDELTQLHAMREKLQSGRIEIVVFGEISTGKSALINALLGEARASVHVQGGWTRDVWHLAWDGVGYRVPGFAASEVVLVDTPGLNEVDGAERASIARQAAARADLILFVTDSDLNETEYSALVELAASHKPIVLVLNKVDLYSRAERAQLLTHFTELRLAGLVEPPNIVSTTADPREVEYLIESPDGTVRCEWRKPAPDVMALRVRMLELLDQEGKSLLALNAALFAADKTDRIASMRVRMREDRAQAVIWSYAVVKAGAVAMNPIALVDVVGGSAVDATMVATLAGVYGIRLTTANARELVESILAGAGWMMLTEAVTHLAAGIFKSLTLGHGTVLTALPQGAAAGYGSYIVGQAARFYFEHGASWGHEAPKTVIARILENTDKQSVLAKLKEEIGKKIRINRYAGEKK